MAPQTLTSAAQIPTASELKEQGLGLCAESSPLSGFVAGTALTSQRVQGVCVGLRAGAVIDHVATCLTVAASGTSPTHMRMGLADLTGKMLAVTADTTAAATWLIGVVSLALTAAYTVPTSGLYIIALVQNGTFSVTEPSFATQTAVDASQNAAVGSNPPRNFQWAAQTDLPAVASSLTITTPSAYTFWAAALGTLYS